MAYHFKILCPAYFRLQDVNFTRPPIHARTAQYLRVTRGRDGKRVKVDEDVKEYPEDRH